MAYNKVIYGGKTLMDLTSDTVTPETLAKDVKAHNSAGEAIVGTSTKDSDTMDATATAAEILFGKTGYVLGNKITGTMPNNGAIGEKITKKDQSIIIPQGYHDGSGTVSIDEVEQKKLISENIKEGVTILNVVGTLEPSSAVTAESKTVTPTTAQQTVLPNEGIDYLSQVIVEAIPYVETENAAGGITVTIAG